MRALILAVLLSLSACARPPAVAPAWTRRVVGGDCDASGVLDLALLQRARGPLGALASSAVDTAQRASPVRIPSGTQVEACVRVGGRSGGEIESWLVVVRGLPRDAARELTAEAKPLPSGAVEVGSDRGIGRLFVFDRTWVLASPSLGDRVRGLSESEVDAPMVLASGSFLALALRANGAKRIASEWGRGSRDLPSSLATGLAGATLEANLDGERLEAVVHARYDSEERARGAEGALRAAWHGVRERAPLASVVRLDMHHDGATVTARFWVDVDAPPEAVTQPLHVSPGSFPSACPPSQRLDLDRRACVEAR